jgi:LysR family transcriptional activator of nhaA
MQWLNYHHLLYFWVVAREGSVAKACRELKLAQPTISGQLRVLEDSLGQKLFQRSGRGLALTETGELVFEYAERIFAIGSELSETLRSHQKTSTLVVGIADVLPKLVAYHLLAPIKREAGPLNLVCKEGSTPELCTELAVNKLDVVLSDSPMAATVKVKAYNHLLGESGMSFLGTKKLFARYQKNFPRSLSSAPILLPSRESAVRGLLDHWFESLHVKPIVVGEFADTALMTMFGEEGEGIFPVPTIVAHELQRHGSVELIGTTEDVVERFYAISIEKRLKHPAVLALLNIARHELFSRPNRATKGRKGSQMSKAAPSRTKEKARN